MSTSVRTKAKKKQPALSPLLSEEDKHFEQSLLLLENACLSVLEMPLARNNKN